ncbi:ribonuclease III [Candidatus Wolfebacteria bacterium]|nr:MAG: ribonuclease III [Candidatus Wolfebacteria bacterium]
MDKDFSTFEKKTKITFKDKNLLTQAFVHRSYINENPKLGLSHNERLEFLGDAVLELAVTNYLFNKYKNKTEGELTAFRSALVNSVILADTARELGMGDYLLLSKGESKDMGRARQYILANTFEAFTGAIYMDQGYEAAEKFIASAIYDKIDAIVSKGLWKDAKSLVQEKAQEQTGVTPEYKVISEVGLDHEKSFVVGIYFDKEKIAEGKGGSKQDAEQKAAEKALELKKWRKNAS